MSAYTDNLLYGSEVEKLLQGRIVIPKYYNGSFKGLDAELATIVGAFTYDTQPEYQSALNHFMYVLKSDHDYAVPEKNNYPGYMDYTDRMQLDGLVFFKYNNQLRFRDISKGIYTFRDYHWNSLENIADKVVYSFIVRLWPYQNYIDYIDMYDYHNSYMYDGIWSWANDVAIERFDDEKKQQAERDRILKMWDKEEPATYDEYCDLLVKMGFPKEDLINTSYDVIVNLESIKEELEAVVDLKLMLDYHKRFIEKVKSPYWPSELSRFNMKTLRWLKRKCTHPDHHDFLDWAIENYEYYHYIWCLPYGSPDSLLIPHSVQYNFNFEPEEDGNLSTDNMNSSFDDWPMFMRLKVQFLFNEYVEMFL